VAQSAPAAAVAATEPAAQSHSYDFSGLNVGETDAPIFHDFGNAMAKLGASQEHVTAALGWYQERVARESAADEKIQAITFDTLKKEWGGEFDSNIGQIRGYLSGLSPSVAPWLIKMSDYSADGVKMLLNLARQAPVDVAAPAPAADGELAKLKAMMADHRSAYWRGDNAERNQARYRELVDANPPQQPSADRGGYTVGSRQRFVPS
jgi:hypothetical protein